MGRISKAWDALFGPKKAVATHVQLRASDIFNNDDDLKDRKPVDDSRVLKSTKTIRLTEAAGFPFANPDEGTEFDDKFFKRIGVGDSVDLPLEILHKAMRLSFLLHRKNPRGKRAIELPIDFILGPGLRVKAVDPDVQKLLDANIVVNRWRKRSDAVLRGLSLHGEQLWIVDRSRRDGILKIKTVSPLKIIKVIRNKKDASELVAVKIVVRTDSSSGMQKTKTFKIVQETEEGKLVGDAIFTAVNRVDGGTRGVPDLLASMDWLEGVDGFAFSMLERAEISQDVVYDLTIEGADEKEVKDILDNFVASMQSGGAFAHNDKVTLKILVPELGAADSEKANSMFVKNIQAGTGLAGLFYGDSDDLTRSSASEITVPSAKMIQRRQALFIDMLRETMDLQLAHSADKLSGKDLSYEIQLPKVFLKDMSTITRAMVELGTSLELAEVRGWVTPKQAQTLYQTAAEQLDVQLVNEGDSPDPDLGNLDLLEGDDVEGLAGAMSAGRFRGGNGSS